LPKDYILRGENNTLKVFRLRRGTFVCSEDYRTNVDQPYESPLAECSSLPPDIVGEEQDRMVSLLDGSRCHVPASVESTLCDLLRNDAEPSEAGS
jgi:hypothetical protein